MKLHMVYFQRPKLKMQHCAIKKRRVLKALTYEHILENVSVLFERFLTGAKKAPVRMRPKGIPWGP